MSDAEKNFLHVLVSAHEKEPDAVIAIAGPTGSGKTALALDFADAVGGEIVTADSVQVYRGFDIGSGKATAEERARATHHLIDIASPLESFDAARFAELGSVAIADIRARGRVPIVCGGTYLWTKALLFGLADAPPADAEVRERHRALAASEGNDALFAKLREVNPKSAERLHPNDVLRVSRALEVHELTGKPMSAWQAEHGFATPRFRSRVFAIAMPSEVLTPRIEARVGQMFAAGWIDEVRGLYAQGFGEARAMGAVGYREVSAHVRGELPRHGLEAAIVRATRVFARRQRTWLNLGRFGGGPALIAL